MKTIPFKDFVGIILIDCFYKNVNIVMLSRFVSK